MSARKADRPLSPDWIHRTHSLIKQAETAGALSMNLRDQSGQTKKLVDKETQKHHQSVNDQLRKKVSETQALITKLQQRISACSDEMGKLTHFKKAAQKMYDDRNGPLRLAEKRERVRARMPPREVINDNVQRALERENADLRDACEQLANIIAQAEDQGRRLEQQRQLLQADLADKTTSLQLDQQCLEVQNHPDKDRETLKATIGTRPKLELSDPRKLTQKSGTMPDMWKKSTAQLVEECIGLEQGSEKIRNNIQRIMRLLEASNSQSSTHVQNSLKNKIRQSTTLQTQLMKKLQDVNQELDHLQEEKQQLISTLQAKMGPLKVVRERLTIRKNRPERESVRDGVEEALEAELSRLKVTITSLEQKLDHVDGEQKRLAELKRQLEADLADKSAALRLDRRCLELDLDQLSQRSTPPHTPSYMYEAAVGPRPPPSPYSDRSHRSSHGSPRLTPLQGR